MGKAFGMGIIGCGLVSEFHAKAVESIENAVLIGVSDTSPSRCSDFAKKHSCRTFDSTEALLACPDIDVVSICTPSGMHASLCIQTASAGKHVIIEKPMAITASSLDEVIEAAENADVKIAVISQLRFTKAVEMTKKAITEGRLGRLISGDAYMKYYRSPEYYSSGAWRGTWEMDGGGALMNQGIHGIDLLLYLMSDVRSVTANCRTLLHDIEVEDTAHILVEYKNGALGTIIGTTSVKPGYPRLIEINGTKGTVVLCEDSIAKWDVEGEDGSLYVSEQCGAGFNDPAAIGFQNHALQIRDFLCAISEGRRPLVDALEGRRAVDLILAAYKSSEAGRKIMLAD